MIRLTLLLFFIAFLACYAWKDWYKSLCGLILLTAVIQHPDMPTSMLGIQGLNPWNILLVVILLAWYSNRKLEKLNYDMPRRITKLLLIYFAAIVIGLIRMLFDYSGMADWARLTGNSAPTILSLVSENFINCIKWVVPGLLMFDGCRSRKRFYWGLFSLLGIYFLLSIQVIRWIPISEAFGGDSINSKSAKLLLNEIGYHRVNLSMMLAGASWAIFASTELVATKLKILMLLMASFVVAFAQALTGGRAGYVTWVVVGVTLCILKWRKYLLLLPVVGIVVVGFVPAVWERMTQGFSPETHDSNPLIENGSMQRQLPKPDVDLYTVTSGRTFAWPFVIDKILEAPLFGYGREAMQRIGLSSYLLRTYYEIFGHPHNAYLQFILDNGIIGFIPVILLFLILLKYSADLFKNYSDPIAVTIGGACLSLLLALMVASIGSQSFYPREGAVGMWCAIGLMLRIYVERLSIKKGKNLFEKF